MFFLGGDMKLVKCAIPHSLYNSYVYCKMGEIVEEKSSVLLGFKDCLPVITNSVANCEKNNEGPSKKILKLQVDPNTGEKFINLNGKKLKMVPESQIKSQFSLKKNLLMKSAKSFRILTKIPFNSNLVHKIQPMNMESHLNLITTENVDPSLSQPLILNERNVISHKNPITDKDNKNIFGNLVKEITADNKGNCEYIDCVTADGIKCTQRIPAFDKIDMKVYSNDQKDQSLDPKKCSTSQIGETLKDAAIQTNENDLINLPPDLDKQTDSIFGLDLSDLSNDLNYDFNSILFEGVDPILASPPVQSTSIAAKFFGELRRAHLPDYEGNM